VYEIVGPLGAGGMGEVYRARDPRLRREVAIKVLPADVAGDPARRARFEREAHAVASLSHPNIHAIHDIGSDDGVTYAVMELLDGRTLREVVGGGPRGLREAVDVARRSGGASRPPTPGASCFQHGGAPAPRRDRRCRSHCGAARTSSTRTPPERRRPPCQLPPPRR